ncbi:unnamed protein product, partial [Rotaria sp. Silwood2]
GQGPSNIIATTISKRLTPPNKNREAVPIRKILSHCKNISTKKTIVFNKQLSFKDIRLHGRRNDIPKDNDLSDSYSIMSADSIKPNDSNEVLKKPKTFNQYSPRRNFLNIKKYTKSIIIRYR